MYKFKILILFFILGACTLNNDSADLLNDHLSTEEISKVEVLSIKQLDKGIDNFENELFGDAYENFNSYLNIVKSKGNDQELIQAYILVASIYKEKLVHDVALDFFLLALELSKNINDKTTGDIYTSIGGIYYDQENFNKSKGFYQKSLDSYLKNNQTQDIAASYNNIGEIYRFDEDFDKALEYYTKAIEINKKYKNEKYLAINYSNIGNVYLEQGSFDKALNSFIKSHHIFKKINDFEFLTASYSEMAYYFFMIGNYNKSIEYYKKTLESIHLGLNDNNIVLKDAYHGLSITYGRLHTNDSAFKYYKKYIHLKEIIHNSDQQKQLFEIQTKYETRQKEREIIELQDLAKKELEKKKTRTVFTLILIGLLVLIVVLLIYSYKFKNDALKQKTLLFSQTNKLNLLEIKNKDEENKRLVTEKKELEARAEISKLNKEKLEWDIKHKERELSTIALQVIGKNEMLSNLKKSIQKLIDGGESHPEKLLRDSVIEITNNINLDKDWDDFKMHFEKVHQGFFKRLLDTYEDLTSEDLKFCAYLRINLSTKEMAQILNITPVAINKRRNRLRKKLQLNPGDDLIVFLSKI